MYLVLVATIHHALVGWPVHVHGRTAKPSRRGRNGQVILLLPSNPLDLVVDARKMICSLGKRVCSVEIDVFVVRTVLLGVDANG